MLAGLAPAKAVITDVRYGIKYNTVTCRYDIYMKVLAGSTTSGSEQQASTAQISVVVPTGTSVGSKATGSTKIRTSSIFSNEPQDGQLELNGSATRFGDATNWTNANAAINRTNLSGYDVYSFTPTVSGAFYPVLATGDSVVLFSLNIAAPACGSGVRLWNNNVIQGTTVTTGPTDPTSANFGGDDYNNGMGIGSATQRYNSNSATITPPKPIITASRSITGNSILLNSSATVTGTCTTIDPTSYRWIGPAGYNQTGQNKVISPFTAANIGTYSVSVSDNLGCSSSLTLASIPLPVTIASFGATANKCSAVLNWSTSSENGFDRFIVQYSTYGSSYMNIGEVASRKSESGSGYAFSYAQTSGKGYYRLKMMDLNGTFNYSETVSVSTSCGTAKGDISISPNPTSGTVNIRGIAAGTQIRIMDMIGKVVANEVSNGNTTSVNLAAYANGIYNVLVSQDGSWEKVGQIVKN